MIQSNLHHEVPYSLALSDPKSGLHLKKSGVLEHCNFKTILLSADQVEFFSITYHPQNQVKNQRPGSYCENIVMVALSQTGRPSSVSWYPVCISG